MKIEYFLIINVLKSKKDSNNTIIISMLSNVLNIVLKTFTIRKRP